MQFRPLASNPHSPLGPKPPKDWQGRAACCSSGGEAGEAAARPVWVFPPLYTHGHSSLHLHTSGVITGADPTSPGQQ